MGGSNLENMGASSSCEGALSRSITSRGRPPERSAALRSRVKSKDMSQEFHTEYVHVNSGGAVMEPPNMSVEDSSSLDFSPVACHDDGELFAGVDVSKLFNDDGQCTPNSIFSPSSEAFGDADSLHEPPTVSPLPPMGQNNAVGKIAVVEPRKICEGCPLSSLQNAVNKFQFRAVPHAGIPWRGLTVQEEGRTHDAESGPDRRSRLEIWDRIRVVGVGYEPKEGTIADFRANGIVLVKQTREADWVSSDMLRNAELFLIESEEESRMESFDKVWVRRNPESSRIAFWDAGNDECADAVLGWGTDTDFPYARLGEIPDQSWQFSSSSLGTESGACQKCEVCGSNVIMANVSAIDSFYLPGNGNAGQQPRTHFVDIRLAEAFLLNPMPMPYVVQMLSGQNDRDFVCHLGVVFGFAKSLLIHDPEAVSLLKDMQSDLVGYEWSAHVSDGNDGQKAARQIWNHLYCAFLGT